MKQCPYGQECHWPVLEETLKNYVLEQKKAVLQVKVEHSVGGSGALGSTSTAVRPTSAILRPAVSGTSIPAVVPVAAAMSVLIAVPTIEDGAAGRGAVEIADMLCADGHRAIVVSGGGRLEPGLASGAAKLVRLDMTSRNPTMIARNAFVLKDLILKNRCTVVHALARGPAWSALLAARVTGTPFVTTWYNGFRDQNILKRFYNGVMARGDRVIAASDQLAEAIAQRHGLGPERLVVIPSRVDVANFDPARVATQRLVATRDAWGIGKELRIILVVGRILRRKGHHVVVKAARRLKDMGLRDFAFVFVGEDDGHSGYSGELWDLVQATNTADVIRFAGAPDDLPAAFGTSVAVVSSSIQLEGTRRSLLRAMAMARPVIASDFAAGPELVLAPPAVAEDRMTGLRIPSGRDDELAAAVVKLLSSPEATLRAIGRRGREHAMTLCAKAADPSQILSVYAEIGRHRSH
jgi:glycosyltransferase involved in cell wall biosynthesis